jgi:hypothetical protein
VNGFAAAVSAWTGNDTRVLEYAEEEIAQAGDEEVLANAFREGVEIAGSIRSLRHLHPRGQS